MLRFDEHGRIGLISDIFFNIQFHTISPKSLRFDEHFRIGPIFNLFLHIQYNTIGLK